MPHFVIDCSENVLLLQTPEEILRAVHETANATGLFKEADIKVRIRAFDDYLVGGEKADFIHVFANIMEGRSVEQKSDLSRKITGKLKSMLPDVPVVSINVRDFEKATYCNRNMI